MPTALLDSARKLSGFRKKLLDWFGVAARDLPWRVEVTPYRIWISEVMLQQTTVAMVVPHFLRFLEKFPSVEALAAAPEEDVLRMWEGLGYYSRARNLRRAAQVIMEEHGGVFPETVAGLMALPGIGRYTAGAVASFAFHIPAPIVEANTIRLYARLMGYADDPKSTAGLKALWSFAEEIVSPTEPSRFNQAVMELGSLVCTPAAPDCPKCPVQKYCVAYQTGRQDVIPKAAGRPVITAVSDVTALVRRDGEYLLRKRQPKERWAGMWDFPRYTLPEISESEAVHREVLVDSVRRDYGIEMRPRSRQTVLKHGVTRYRITLYAYESDWESGEAPASAGETAWIAPADFDRYPLSVTGRQLAKWLREPHLDWD